LNSGQFRSRRDGKLLFKNGSGNLDINSKPRSRQKSAIALTRDCGPVAVAARFLGVPDPPFVRKLNLNFEAGASLTLDYFFRTENF